MVFVIDSHTANIVRSEREAPASVLGDVDSAFFVIKLKPIIFKEAAQNIKGLIFSLIVAYRAI